MTISKEVKVKKDKLIIKSIEEGDVEDRYKGIYIQTNKATLKFEISSSRQCCEHFGYFSYSEFDKPYEHFIGAEIYQIFISNDKNENQKVFDITEGIEHSMYDIDAAVFINVMTSKGKMQIIIYNEHNGYYGHEIRYSLVKRTGEIEEKESWK